MVQRRTAANNDTQNYVEHELLAVSSSFGWFSRLAALGYANFCVHEVYCNVEDFLMVHSTSLCQKEFIVCFGPCYTVNFLCCD